MHEENRIEKTLDRLEKKLQQAETLGGEQKKQLLGEVAKLREELPALSQTRGEHAESIMRFAELSAYEATRNERDPELLDAAVKGLSSSVREFEVSHPKLVGTVNSLCMMLSHLGI